MEDEGHANAPTPIDSHFIWFWVRAMLIPKKDSVLDINVPTEYAVCVCFRALGATTICYLLLIWGQIWGFLRPLAFVGVTFVAFYYYIAPHPKHRVSLFTVLFALSSWIALMHVVVYGMSFSFCYNTIVPVNVPYTKAAGQLLFDPSYDIFNVSLMQHIGTNTTINVTDTISLSALNQTYCFRCSISPFGKGIEIDIKEATSEEDMFQVLVARRAMFAEVVEEMWKLLGIDHNKSDTYKAVRFYEQLLLPAHLYHIEMMQQAIRAVGRENQTGMGEDKVAAGKTRGSPKEGSSAEDEGGMEGEDKLGD